MTMGLLSLAIWLPIVSGTVLLVMGRRQHPGTVRWVALLAALASFAVTLPLVAGFDNASAALQFQEKFGWIERFNVNYTWGSTACRCGSSRSRPSSPSSSWSRPGRRSRTASTSTWVPSSSSRG